MSLKATKAGAIYTSDAVVQGVGEMDWADYTLTVKTSPKEMIVLSGGSATSLKTVDLVTTGEELVVYDGIAVKSGLTGTVSAVVGNNNPGSSTTFISDYPTRISNCTLTDGNLFIAHNASATQYGQFTIVSQSGTVIVPNTTFNASGTISIKCLSLSNGNIFIAWSDSDNLNYGKFKIIDPIGNTVVNTTTFYANTSNDISATILQDNNIMVVFSNQNSYGTLVIISQSGSILKAATTFTSTNCQTLCANTLLNGNVMVSYRGASSSMYGSYSILSSSGIVVKSNTAFNTIDSTFFESVTLQNGNSLIAYRRNTGYGEFVILDPSGVIVKSPTVFTTTNNAIEISSVLLFDGRVFTGWMNGNSSIGEYVIFNEDGTIFKSLANYYSSVGGNVDATLTLDGKVFLAYQSIEGSGQIGKYQLINTGTVYTSDITSLALSGTPTKAWKKTNLPETYTSFEGTGRTLLADKSVDMVSSTASQVVFKDTLAGLLKTGDELGVEVGVDNLVVTTSSVVETPVIVDNLPGTPIFFNGETVGDFGISQNGENVLFAFADTNDSYKGKYIIRDSSGNIIKTKTEFEAAITSNVVATTLLNGYTFIIFTGSSGASNKYIIVNTVGDIVGSGLTGTGAHNHLNCTTLKNGNVFHIYPGGFLIFNNSGGIVKTATPLPSNNTNYNVVTTLKNGNVLVVYSDLNNNGYGVYLIYDALGNIVKSASVFSTVNSIYFSSSVFDNGNVLIAYTDVNASSGKFIIVNESGIIQIGPTTFSNSSSFKQTTTLLSGNVLIAYTNPSNSYSGRYIVLNSSGSIIIPESVFRTPNAINIKCCIFSDGNTCVAYADASASSRGTYCIINTGNYSTYTCTIPAQVSAPLTAKIPARSTLNTPYSYAYISSNLNIIYTKVTKAAREFRFKHIAKNINDTITNTYYALNKSI